MSGVGITGLIEPLNNGAFPVWEDINGKGGLRTVADITARNAVSANALFCKEGMVVYVALTKCYYSLGSDLATWTIIDSAAELGAQLTWFISTTGSDSNDGLTSLTSLRTTEELCQRLCPGGKVRQLSVAPTITIGAGSFGKIDLFLDGTALGPDNFFPTILGSVTNVGAAITLSAVVNTAQATSTRGQLTTVSGTFITKTRIKSTSGAQANLAIAYSTGLNGGATNTFVAHWIAAYGSGHSVNIANATTCQVETLGTTLEEVNIIPYGSVLPVVQDCIITNGGLAGFQALGGSVNGTVQLIACEFTAGAVFVGSWDMTGCKIPNVSFNNSYIYMYGCYVTGLLTVLASTISFREPCCFDGGRILITEHSSLQALHDTEFENGIAGTAVQVNSGSWAEFDEIVWGASTVYTTGFVVNSNAAITFANTATASTLNIPSTNNVNISGVNYPYAQLPVCIPNNNCGVYPFSYATGLSLTFADKLLTAQAANIGATNLFTAQPKKGIFRFSAYMSIQTAGTTGVPVVNAIFTDTSGAAARTVQVLTLATLAQAGQGGSALIECNGATQIQFSVTGIVTPGALAYSLRISCTAEPNG